MKFLAVIMIIRLIITAFSKEKIAETETGNYGNAVKDPAAFQLR